MANRLLTGGECPQGILDVVEGAIGYLALSNGFAAIEYAALRILSNLFLSFTEDLGASALSNAESAGRTTILLSDIVLTLVDMGVDLRGLNELPRRRQYRGFKEPVSVGNTSNRGVCSTAVIGPNGSTIIPRPLSLRSDWPAQGRGLSSGTQGVTGVATTAGTDQPVLPPPAPAHIQLPPLPEPHTFLSTHVNRPPVAGDPSSLRRRVAEQRRKVQQSLIHFLARIHPVQYLFPGDPESFMLISPKKSSRPYLDALLTDSISDLVPNDVEEQPIGVSKTRTSLTPTTTTSTKTVNCGGSINPYLLKPKFPEY
ncbi:unnamed protein product [Calicophoron daubneyi]|uniref:Transcription initiation factor TFIID subunit 8 n=1 Tax=Calicophoron daubneyi TaxID=300641 RepID=A0AAV2TGI1_CALDB